MRIIVRQLNLLMVSNYNSFLHYWLVIVVIIVTLFVIHSTAIPHRDDQDYHKQNHKEVGKAHAWSMINMRMIVEMIVVVHVVVIDKDYRSVEVVVIPVKSTIGIVAAIRRHSCGSAIARSRCWLHCSIIAV